MSFTLYNKEILRLAASIPRLFRLPDPDVTITKTSRICGSRVTIDAVVHEGVITDYGQEVKACALGQAACSLVGRRIIGQTRESFAPAFQAIQDILVAGDDPVQEWAELSVFLPVREHKARHASVLLPFQAVIEAFDQIERERDKETNAGPERTG